MKYIALYSYRELVRERFVHILFFGAFLRLLLCFPLGTLSFEERGRVLYHFGFSAISFTAVGLALFLGSSRLNKEFERQTSLIVLARPITRQDFFLGKWLGLGLLLGIIVMGLTLILYVLMTSVLQEHVHFRDVVFCGSGIALEALILMTLTMSSSLFLRNSICFFFGLGIYLFGNFIPDFVFFAERSKDATLIQISRFVGWILPELYRLNWRSLTLAEKQLPSWSEFLWSMVHGLTWTGLILWLGVMIFRRKDLV